MLQVFNAKDQTQLEAAVNQIMAANKGFAVLRHDQPAKFPYNFVVLVDRATKVAEIQGVAFH
jgi:hypothetical protein